MFSTYAFNRGAVLEQRSRGWFETGSRQNVPSWHRLVRC